MSDVVNVVRAELYKLVRRPAVWVLLTLAMLLNSIFRYVIPYLGYRSGGNDMTDGLPPQQVLDGTLPGNLVLNTIGGFPIFSGALALTLGALILGGEHGWGTVKTLLTQRPGRLAVITGQFAALALALAGALAIMTGLSAGISSGIAVLEDQAIVFPAVSDLASGLGAGWLILMMWSFAGAVMAVLFRGVALPIGIGVVWVLGLENLVSAMATSVLTALQPLRDVLPGVNAGSLVSSVAGATAGTTPPGVTTTVDGGRALATVTAYALVALVAAALSFRRRDVA